ncbi:choice-of-anchor D domain-containing protein [bacterium]|nr:choice-of-anchor D domain-containing protein [bacterium]
MVLEFAPSTNSSYSGNFSLSYQSGLATSSTLTLALTGKTEAKLTLTPSSTSFTNTAQGGASTLTITVQHTGGASASTFVASAVNGAPFSISASTCTGTLSTSGTCTLTVRFAPTTSAGSFSTAVSLQFNNGLATDTITSATLSGVAVERATLSSSVASLDFGSVIQTGQSSPLSVQISVPSTAGVSATSISASTASPFSITQNCATSLTPNTSCTISVRANPTTLGLIQGNLSISYFNGASTQTLTIPLQVTGQRPALLIFVPSTTLDFGNVSVGSSSSAQMVQIQNTGGVPATSIQGAFFTGYGFLGGTFPGVNGDCTTTLAAGASCLIEVVFSPNQGGNFTSSSGITLSYHNGAAAATPITRAFTGKSDALITLPASQSFGSVVVGSSATSTITLSYSGFGNANSLSGNFNSSSFRFLGGSFPGTTGSCGSTVSSGSCTIVVEFVPGNTGSHSATLTLNYSNDNGTARSTSMSLIGTGLAPANLQISGSASVSPTVNGSTTNFDLTLTNNGGTAATSISAASISSPFRFQGSGSYPGGGTCGSSLNANSSCTIKLAYAPTSTGSHSATLTINYNNGLSSSQSVSQALSGSSGSVASLTANPTSLAFGQVVVGQSSTLSFTLQNAVSTVPATSISVSGLSTHFTVTSNTCSQLTASSTCSISIRYQPQTSGTFSQTATISYNNGSTTTSLSVGVTGTTPASYTISPADNNSLGDKPAGVTQTLTYTITRTGGPVSTSLSGSTFTMNSGSGTLGYAGGNFPGSTGTCTNTMTLSSCTVVLEVTPTNQGTFSGTWTLQADTGNGTTTLSRTFTGNSVPATYAISPADNNNVGDRAAGMTHSFTYTITRTGGPSSTALTGSSFTSSGAGTLGYAGGSFPGTGGTCANPMITSSCTVVLAMNLTSAGSFSGTWSIQAGTGAGTTPLSRTLLGNSVAASYAVSPADNNNVGDKATGATQYWNG